MGINSINPDDDLGYSALKSRVKELARRVNLLTQMEVSAVSADGAAKFDYSDKSIRLNLPTIENLLDRISAIELPIDSGSSCDLDLAEAEAQVAALQSQVDSLADTIAQIQEELTPAATQPEGGGCWSGSLSPSRYNAIEDCFFTAFMATSMCLEPTGTAGVFDVTVEGLANECSVVGTCSCNLSNWAGIRFRNYTTGTFGPIFNPKFDGSPKTTASTFSASTNYSVNILYNFGGTLHESSIGTFFMPAARDKIESTIFKKEITVDADGNIL